MTGTLAMALRYWDKDWAKLPAWEVFNIRPLEPIWHDILAASGGPPPNLAGNLAWIPCGTFTMGSPANEPLRSADEGPQTRVTISQGFWMGKFEVTQGEYLALMGNNPSFHNGVRYGYFLSCGCWDNVDYGTDLSRPVEEVSWNDVVAYCAALTARERSAGRLPAGYLYRLPTEAEWEYACRAGTTTAFHYGEALRSGMANFDGRYEYPPCPDYLHGCWNSSGIHLERPMPGGRYEPNPWGLYDMHGNVMELCQDWYGTYPGGSVSDPQGPATGSRRVSRGGSCSIFVYGFACRSAYRGSFSYTQGTYGFRVVLAPGQP